MIYRRALLDKAAARVEAELAELREDVRADTVDDVRARRVIVAVARKDQRAVRRLRGGTVQVQAHEQVRALLLCKVHASLHLAQWRRIIRAVTIGARHVHMDMAVRLELLLEIEADPEHAVRLLIAVGAVDRTGVISARAVAAVTGVDRDVQPVGILARRSLVRRRRSRCQQRRRQSHSQKKRQDSLHHLSGRAACAPVLLFGKCHTEDPSGLTGRSDFTALILFLQWFALPAMHFDSTQRLTVSLHLCYVVCYDLYNRQKGSPYMDMTLVVMAAGLGSRYGGVKQIERLGPDGEILMEYAIYDALRAGFDRIVLIIKPSMLEDVRALFGDRIEQRTGIRIDYAFQTPERFTAASYYNTIY